MNRFYSVNITMETKFRLICYFNQSIWNLSLPQQDNPSSHSHDTRSFRKQVSINSRVSSVSTTTSSVSRSKEHHSKLTNVNVDQFCGELLHNLLQTKSQDEKRSLASNSQYRGWCLVKNYYSDSESLTIHQSFRSWFCIFNRVKFASLHIWWNILCW